MENLELLHNFDGKALLIALALWAAAFNAWRAQRFKRMWLFYLCYCESGFRAGRINVGQFMLSKTPLPASKL